MPAPLILVSGSDTMLVARIQRDLESKQFGNRHIVDGLEVWREVKEHGADLLIADIHTPGLDGFQLCRLLGGEAGPGLPKLPVILVSPAYHDDMVAQIARAVGAWQCVQGPLEAVNFADLAAGALSPHPVATPVADAGRRRARLVLAEDSPSIQKMLSFYLGRQGYEVVAALDGEEAEARIKEATPDLLLVDYHMPKKDGLEVVRWARQNRPQMAIIMMTAHRSEDFFVELLRAGVDDFVQKPFEPAAIGPIVEVALRKASVRNVDLQFREKAIELVQVHQRVVRSERLAAIGEIGLAVRHEINNPLTSLLGQAEMLLAGRAPLTEDAKRRVQTIHDMAMRIKTIVQRLEDIKEARTVPYLESSRMTDLHGPDPAR
ncbi:MAG: response regulator [Planctomycetes bacterium]|nr:response regulator [Planctomycetota bacterium]